MAKKSAKSKGYRKQNVKKPYLSKRDILVTCVIVALLAVGAFFLFRYDDGALKMQNGAVVTEGDNWLIVNGSNIRGRARYFKLGEMGEIEGYSREKTALSTDGNIPSYVFTPSPEDGNVTLTVSTGHSAAETVASSTAATLGLLENNDVGELQTAELSGQTAHYFIYTSSPVEEVEANTEEADAESAEAPAEEADEADSAEEEAETSDADQYTKALAGYFDAAHDSSVVVLVESHAETADACLSDDAMTALLEQAIAAVTLEEAE